MRVLIIDDEPLVRRSLARAFELRGHNVQLAENGKVGLQSWEVFQPDLILLDVLMPEMTGPQVLAARTLQHRGVVVLISAYSGDYNLQKAHQLGADLFIEKPFEHIFKVVELCEQLIDSQKRDKGIK